MPPGSSSYSGNMINGSPINVGDGADIVIGGDTTNDGDINFLGAGSYTTNGNFMSNSGALNMANGQTGNSVNVGGNYVSTGSSTMSVDIDLALAQSDTLNVTGSATGDPTQVTFQTNGTVGFVTDLIVVDTGAVTAPGTFYGTIPDIGIVSYTFAQDGLDGPDPGDVDELGGHLQASIPPRRRRSSPTSRAPCRRWRAASMSRRATS